MKVPFSFNPCGAPIRGVTRIEGILNFEGRVTVNANGLIVSALDTKPGDVLTDANGVTFTVITKHQDYIEETGEIATSFRLLSSP